ncbi:MAG TPA: hypothetical protein PL110_10630, partial [Candidatus Eremiobacteraeota bacterium]|nr:hypothetical protein [Candidatus Eremiobacteraeota bacterium]
MNLMKPVKLKNVDRTFEDYCNTVREEELSSINYLNSSDISWHVPESLKKKVSSSGQIMPYFGDTVVLNLEKEDINFLSAFQSKLLEELPDLFSEPLEKKYFHITLHDLTSGIDKSVIEHKMEENRVKCEKIFIDLRDYFKKFPNQATVTLKPLFIYPCCNISMVMGFIPFTERDFRIIMNMYNLFDDVIYLDYWLRLHMTLAYFKPTGFSKEQIRRLYDTLIGFKMPDFVIKLDIRNLTYQRFNSMNE